MDRLESALQRLYGWPDVPPRCLRVTFRRSYDWPQVAGLLRVVQDELGLPVPGVSVSGAGGYSVWFAFAEAISPADSAAFLRGLRERAMPDVRDTYLEWPPLTDSLPVIPAFNEESGRWSAFIDPGMGSLFLDESGLDFEPPRDRQADLLAGLQAIDVASFRCALAALGSSSEAGGNVPEQSTVIAHGSLASHFDDPRVFLRAVMNDAATPLALRIEAAKALLAGDERR